MRSDVGITPYAKYYMPYLNGEKLEHCRMADEELGCAEIYVLNERGHRTLATRMVFGRIELKPLTALDPWNNPADAAAIDQRRAGWDAEIAASDWPKRKDLHSRRLG